MTTAAVLSDTGHNCLQPHAWHAAGSLCWREMVRFFRQPNRVIGAVGQPLLFWLLFGAGMNRTFHLPDQSFREYYFPGTVFLVLLFTAIFATISIIEDRREGFLQSVLVAPTPRWAMVLGKVLGGALIALAQALVFLLLALTLGIRFGGMTMVVMTVWLFLSAFGMTSLGFILAWRMESTQGFHAIMNLLLMPMWLLSGAFFPVPPLREAVGWGEVLMHWTMRVNPVTYAVAGLRHLLYADLPAALVAAKSAMWIPGLPSCWVIMVLFTAVMFSGACYVARSTTAGDVQ